MAPQVATEAALRFVWTKMLLIYYLPLIGTSGAAKVEHQGVMANQEREVVEEQEAKDTNGMSPLAGIKKNAVRTLTSSRNERVGYTYTCTPNCVGSRTDSASKSLVRTTSKIGSNT